MYMYDMSKINRDMKKIGKHEIPLGKEKKNN